MDAEFAEVYAKNDEIVARLETRKEMRKTRGAVRMAPGEAERREVALDNSYFGPEDEEGSSDEEDGEDEGEDEEVDELDESGEEDDGEEDGVSEDEDGDEDEEEEDGEPAPASGKRKRAAKPQKAAARPAKKVAFAAEPKGTKQARSATGAAGSKLAASKAKGGQPKAKPTPEAKPAKTHKKTPSVSAALKIANSSKKGKQASSASKDGEETYDFSKFF